MQAKHDLPPAKFAEAKELVRSKLSDLETDLNGYLAGDYGIEPEKRKDVAAWMASHKPFHWFVDFYGVLNNGGFDVIIGNPPYVSVAKVRGCYTAPHFATTGCPDIYAWVVERVQELTVRGGRSGMILPLNIGFSSDFAPLRQMLFNKYDTNWFSSYGRIPSALFNFDVRVRNTIHLGSKGRTEKRNYTSRLHRWFERARPHLFATLEYAAFAPELWSARVPKVNTQALVSAFEDCTRRFKCTLDASSHPGTTPYLLHFKKTAYNWLNFCRKLPPCYDTNDKRIPHTKFGEVCFRDAEHRDLAMLLANGKFMFVFWCAVADDFDVTRWNFGEFPVDLDKLPKPLSMELCKRVEDLAGR